MLANLDVGPAIASQALWGFWLISWVLAAFWAKPATARPPALAEGLYRLVTVVGFVVIAMSAAGPLADRPLTTPLWRTPTAIQWLIVGLEACGFAFTWWARVHLGALWSSAVTAKADHHIIESGPYGLVRHPIYTGLLTALLAYILLLARPLAFAGFALAALGFWIKARLEESFLRAELGHEAYDAYRARTPMLIPFWPT